MRGDGLCDFTLVVGHIDQGDSRVGIKLVEKLDKILAMLII